MEATELIPDSEPTLPQTSPLSTMASHPVAAAPRRTYGRVQKTADVPNTSSMLGASLTRSDTLETIIPDSEVGHGDDESPQATPTKTRDAFGLWASLKGLDDQFDDDDEPSHSPVKKLSNAGTSAIPPSNTSALAELALRSSLVSADTASTINTHVPTTKRRSVPDFIFKSNESSPHHGNSSSADEKEFFQSSPDARQPSTPGTSPENLGKGTSWSDDENQPPPPTDETTARSPGGLRHRSSSGQTKSREPKIKPLNKKQAAETKRETARLLAQRNVVLPKHETRRLDMADLFQKAQKQNLVQTVFSAPNPPTPSSDISQFSPGGVEPSPVKKTMSSPTFSLNRASALGTSGVFGINRRTSMGRVENDLLGQLPNQAPMSPKKSSTSATKAAASDDEDDIPEISQIFRRKPEAAQPHDSAAATAAQSLRETKLRIIKSRAAAIRTTEDDDDDLEVELMVSPPPKIVPSKERGHRISAPSKGRKQQLALAGIRASAKPPKSTSGTGDNASATYSDLNVMLGSRIQKQGARLRTEKESLWLRKGGKASTRNEEGPSDVLQKALERGAQMRSMVEPELEEDSDEEDGDWSPAPTQKNEDSGGEEGLDAVILVHSTSFVEPEDDFGPEGHVSSADENVPVARFKAGRRSAAVVDSDEEDFTRASDAENLGPSDGENIPPSTCSSFHHDDGSVSPPASKPKQRRVLKTLHYQSPDTDSPEEEEDVFTSPRRPVPQALFSQRLSQRLSEAKSQSRKPLQARGSGLFDDPFESQPVANGGIGSGAGLQAAFGQDQPKAGGFSQFFDDEEATPAPMAGPSNHVVDGNEEGAVTRKANLFKRNPFTKEDPFILGETQVALNRENFAISKTQARRDEEAIAAQADRDAVPNEENANTTAPPLYMNSQGLLTQHRPALLTDDPFALDISTQLGFGSPTSKETPMTKDRLLGGISLSTTPQLSQPRRRIRRRGEVSTGAQYLTSPQLSRALPPSPVKQTLFNQLTAPKPKRSKEDKSKVRSEFVEGEAEESDDDAMMGFGGPSKDGEDEEADDNTPVEGLMDDTEMTNEQRREDLIVEKYHEQAQEDDAELEKLHKNAIAGKLRHKRRDRGLGFEDSDSDADEEDEAKRIRRRMYKKRKIEGDSLDAFAKSEDTLAFYNAYQQGLDEPVDEELLHLNPGPTSTVHGSDDDEDQDDESQERIDVWDLRDELRKAAREKTEAGVISHIADPEDVSWMDETDDLENTIEELQPVQLVAKASLMPGLSQEPELHVYRSALRLNEAEDQRLSKWAREDSQNRTFGIGSGKGKASVTGHSNRSSSPSTSIAGMGPMGSATRRVEGSKLRKEGSLLQSALGKRGRFD